MSPLNVIAALRDAVGEADLVWALKMVLQGRDDLRALLGEGSPGADAWECDPGVLGVPAWDALLRAVTAREFAVADREPPRWTGLDLGGGPWVFASPYFEPDEVRRRTPGWLAERGVYLVDRDLVTA